MRKTALRSAEITAERLSVADIEIYATSWFLDGEIGQLSPQTQYARKFIVGKLVWFLKERGFDDCGRSELTAFIAYLSVDHPDGRWGTEGNSAARPRPRTVETYFGNIRTFFRFLVAEGALSESPMELVKRPKVRRDQIQPFTREQIASLLSASRKTSNPKRDQAILKFLLDTGVRASELCTIRMRDVDLKGRRCTVMGKGEKRRTVFFGGETAKALWQYLGSRNTDDDDPLFVADRGIGAGQALTRYGLLQLIVRWGGIAGIHATRCSPHTFRHTFAVEFLRSGGSTFSLQQLLGHTSLDMTQKYVSLAQADLQQQHRSHSPVDRMMRKKQ
jgi:integrase/recombinase XerC